MLTSHPRAKSGSSTPTSQMANLVGKTVLVTGASSGIGKETAKALASNGANTVLVARNSQLLNQLGTEIRRQYSVDTKAVALDLNDTTRLQDQISRIPRLDGLVNCAGQNMPRFVSEVDENNFDSIFALNVKATFFVTKACVQKFREHHDGGAIVNVSSQMGHVGAAQRSVYCGSKHAVEGFTKALAVELAAENIRVNSVCPTFIRTPMTVPMFEDDSFRIEIEKKIPVGRIGTASDVVGAIVFLLSPAASLITGASLLIDGGWTAQ